MTSLPRDETIPPGRRLRPGSGPERDPGLSEPELAGGGGVALGLGGLVLRRLLGGLLVLAFLQALLELLGRTAEGAGHLGQALRAEQEQDDGEDDDDLR